MDAGGKLVADAQEWLLRTERSLCAIVDRYAVAQAIAHDTYQDDYVTNDFVFYCVTKSTKTLIAINILLKAGLGEDAQILLRSAYENYLAISFLLANPERLDDLVDKKVGVLAGRYQHPLNSKGKKDRRKIEDLRTGEVFPFDVSIIEMVSKGKHPEDLVNHWPLYGFLSEHCHANFIASGNYRLGEGSQYTYGSRFQTVQASIYSLYVFLLLLAEVNDFANLKGRELRQTVNLLQSGTRVLHRALELMVFVCSMKEMPNAMRARIVKYGL